MRGYHSPYQEFRRYTANRRPRQLMGVREEHTDTDPIDSESPPSSLGFAGASD